MREKLIDWPGRSLQPRCVPLTLNQTHDGLQADALSAELHWPGLSSPFLCLQSFPVADMNVFKNALACGLPAFSQ